MSSSTESSSGSESESSSQQQVQEQEDPELELNLAIEAFLAQLEQGPKETWPQEQAQLLEAIKPHCKFDFPMPPELLARFLVQEGLLDRDVSSGVPLFSFATKKIASYDFDSVAEGVSKINEALQGTIPTTPTTLLLFQRVVAWARLNTDELKKYKGSTKGVLSNLLLKIGKVSVYVEPQLVVDELLDRRLISIKEDKVTYDLHHLTGEPKANQVAASGEGGWFRSALYVLVIVLFWGSMLGQIIPQSAGGVGGMAKGKGK
eukprot:TRINITY_DN5794_c0_g1_i3.p2 TRINITY_DN5794_c0_g1~~TRINITY_DN5794_c0_g1_i3.p2  ORF type:complete len:261 (+),score=58.66 TRINITY_DN5794_c0_g1_i3:27-809(+)